jgi:phospholipase C
VSIRFPITCAAIGLAAAVALSADENRDEKLSKVNHFVVIYQENHSFDNLFGQWEGVEGLDDATPSEIRQLNQSNVSFNCLLQDDPNLTVPPLTGSCFDPANSITSAFLNAPFNIDRYIPATANTCPNGTPGGAPGGCTRDLVHRFYQEQYQIHGGAQNHYVTGSDAVGLVMGYYSTRDLPIYKFLHAPGHPHYAISDHFFQSAFGGSFLNHQWLVAAASPLFAGALSDGSANDLHSIVDANGMPIAYPLYVPAGTVKDAQLTIRCPPGGSSLACGDYAVNTTQPTYQPYFPGTAMARRLPPLTNPTIGSRLSSAGIDWAWYAGGWSNANGDIGGPGWTNGSGPTCGSPNTLAGATYPNCPDALFQFHHHPFNYFAAYAPGTSARAAHLRDEEEFKQLARDSPKACQLKPVSLIKPIGAENEHPGYASETAGSQSLVALIQSITDSACAKDTMIIVTYDEFGGQWDHVAPPGQGNVDGPHDQWGPGTRIPAFVIAPWLQGDAVVDHVSHDTTSIIATIERRFGLAPLGTRDAAVQDMSTVFEVHGGNGVEKSKK